MACKVSPWAPCRRQRRMPQSSLTWRRPATRPCSKRSLAAVRIDLLHDLSSVMCRDRHDLGLAVALDQSKHGHLAGSAPAAFAFPGAAKRRRSEEHTSELQSLMRTPYAVFCLQK